MSSFYISGDTPAPWQNSDASVLSNPLMERNAPAILPVSEYEAGRRDGIMIGLMLGALSGSIIVALIGLIAL